jgi:hypothetical protein
MPSNDDMSRLERFEKYNPYAAEAKPGGDQVAQALLALAFELNQLAAAVRFGGGGSSS